MEKQNVNPELPTYPTPKPEDQKPADPVARSIAKPDAFAKPGSLGKPAQARASGTRVRTLGFRASRGRKRKPDLRKVKFW